MSENKHQPAVWPQEGRREGQAEGGRIVSSNVALSASDVAAA